MRKKAEVRVGGRIKNDAEVSSENKTLNGEASLGQKTAETQTPGTHAINVYLMKQKWS